MKTILIALCISSLTATGFVNFRFFRILPKTFRILKLDEKDLEDKKDEKNELINKTEKYFKIIVFLFILDYILMPLAFL